MRHLSRLFACALTAVLIGGGALTAAAQPVVNVIEEGTDSFIIDDCEGLVLEGETTFREHILINARGQDRVLHLQANVSATEVITNPETGKTFTTEFRFLDQDHSVTDNGDGTFTVIIRLSGRVKHFGPDGKLLFVDAGQIVNETLWTDDGFFPSGGTLLDLETIKNVGKSDTEDRDFCADMHKFLG